jgi:hypothetical protein
MGLVGEGTKLGKAVRDPTTKLGTWGDVNVYIYDQNKFDYGRDYFDNQDFDFEERHLKTLAEVKRTTEFQTSQQMTVNGLSALKQTLNDNIYVVVQNPNRAASFVVFEITQRGGTAYQTVFEKSYELLNQILATFVFTK